MYCNVFLLVTYLGVGFMTNGDLGLFKSVLLEKKEKLLHSSRSAMQQIKNSEQTPSDEGDFAVAEVGQFLTCKIHARDRKCLLEIEKALSRMENGQFGSCESCGEEIRKRRLKVNPFSSLCIDCQEDIEQEQKKLA